jgi:hypothetical protein
LIFHSRFANFTEEILLIFDALKMVVNFLIRCFGDGCKLLRDFSIDFQ